MKTVYTAGTLAFFDSACGLIKCKAVKVQTYNGQFTPEVTIKITERKNRGYSYGQIVKVFWYHVVPRDSLMIINKGQYVILDNFMWA